MTPQEPAEGILKQDSFLAVQHLVIACDCTDPDHMAHIYVDASDDIGLISVNFGVHTDYHRWEGWKDRIKAAYEIIFHGSSVRHHDLLLTKQSALNLAHALEVSIEEVELNHINHKK
jgi:hypothetical protein